VPKHVIRIPPLRAGRRVSWTFEVSAAPGTKNRTRAKTALRKRRRAKRPVADTPIPAPHLEAAPVPVPEQPPAATSAVEAIAVEAMPGETMASGETIVCRAEPVVPLAIPAAVQHPPMPIRPTAPARRGTHRRTIALGGAAALVIAALAFPRHPSAPGTDDDAIGSLPDSREQPADVVALNREPAVLPAVPFAAPVAFAAVAPRAVIAPSKKTLAPKPERNRVAESAKAGAPIAAVTPLAGISFKEDTATKLPGSEAIAPSASTAGATGTGETTPVTITGCLEISVTHDEFRLTDTEGADAPKSRSWRTGFLTKRTAPVALVEPPDRLGLQTHVGRRVAATGQLTSHDLKVSALRVVGPTCN
jgi:hypothetical protein